MRPADWNSSSVHSELRSSCCSATRRTPPSALPSTLPPRCRGVPFGETRRQAKAATDAWNGFISTWKGSRAHGASPSHASTMNVAVPLSHPINPWIIRHTSWTKDRFQADREDGLTSFERQNDRMYGTVVVPLGETVVWKLPGHNMAKLTGPWRYGVYCGGSSKNDAHIIANRKGTFTVKSVRRLPEDQRYDTQLFLAMKGTPWNPTGTSAAPAPDTRPRPVESAPLLSHE